jgi:GNAT superfamily N-acetyltransferase
MTPVMADLALARRLERAEGLANRAFVEARARRNPPSGACWREVAGTLAMFDGVASPCTQTFGLGLFDPVNSGDLDVIEEFFRERGAPVIHETCPIAQKELWPLLADRGYRPIEFTSVMVRDLSEVGIDSGTVEVSVAGEDEREVMAQTSAAGWSESMEIPADFLEMMRTISSAASVVSFLARMDGQPVAAAALNINEGVALLAGASTIPEARRRGAQRGLLMARLAYAAGVGCDLAMMGAEPGSSSQRNAQRQGFQIVYTRIKWRLGV